MRRAYGSVCDSLNGGYIGGGGILGYGGKSSVRALQRLKVRSMNARLVRSTALSTPGAQRLYVPTVIMEPTMRYLGYDRAFYDSLVTFKVAEDARRAAAKAAAAASSDAGTSGPRKKRRVG